LPGISVQVADTVGAGDAFTAALLTQHLEGKPLREAARFANAYAAAVASKPGGTPQVERAEVERLL
jgi:fructokinase